MRGEKIWRLLFIIMLLAYVAAQGISVRASDTGTTLSVEPAKSSVAPGGTFDVNITVTNVTNLFGWKIRIDFNSTILNATSLTRGPFLEQAGPTNWQIFELTHPGEQYGVINNTAGLVVVGDSLLPPLPPTGANSSGILVTIGFLVKAEGATPLSFEEELTDLTTVVQGAKVSIPHDRVDGFFEYPVEFHDVAVTSLTAPSEIVQGETANINVDLANEGNSSETFNVTVHYDSSAIDTQTDVSLDPDTNTTLIFTWNTTGVPPNIYTIRAEAILTQDEDPDDNWKETTIRVMVPPLASFAEDPLTPHANDMVTFNASASEDEDGEIVSYKWDFGDETPIVTETDPTTTHVYTSAGTYTVNLTVTDNDDLTDSVTETKTVLPFVEPQVRQYNFTVEVEEEEFLVTIKTNSTIPEFTTYPEQKKISFTVNGTQGTTGFCNVTIPIRLLGGPYLVWLDGERKWDVQETTNDTHVFLYFTYTLSTHTVDITGSIWGPAPEPPLAVFSASTTTPSVGDTVTFNASASHDPDGTIESWNWNFGDGTTGTGEIVNHTYTTAGNFTVTLTVIDDEGLNGTATTGMIVSAVPVHDIAITSVTVSSTEVERYKRSPLPT